MVYTRLIIGVVGTAITVFLCREVNACNCLPVPAPKTAIADATAVFSGKVTKMSQPNVRGYRLVRFEVIRVWKGVTQPTVLVINARDEAMCGYPFAQGQTYLVYARSFKGRLYLSTDLCMRTGLLESAGEDLAAIGHGKSIVFITQQRNMKAAQLKASKKAAR